MIKKSMLLLLVMPLLSASQRAMDFRSYIPPVASEQHAPAMADNASSSGTEVTLESLAVTRELLKTVIEFVLNNKEDGLNKLKFLLSQGARPALKVPKVCDASNCLTAPHDHEWASCFDFLNACESDWHIIAALTHLYSQQRTVTVADIQPIAKKAGWDHTDIMGLEYWWKHNSESGAQDRLQKAIQAFAEYSYINNEEKWYKRDSERQARGNNSKRPESNQPPSGKTGLSSWFTYKTATVLGLAIIGTLIGKKYFYDNETKRSSEK